MDAPTPPRDERLEAAFLGSVLASCATADEQRRVLDLVTPADLWHEQHREVWRIMRRLAERGMVDLNTLMTDVLTSPSTAHRVDRGLVEGLADHAAVGELIPAYAGRLRDLGQRRAILEHAQRVATLAADVAVDLARVEAVAVDAPKASSPRGPWAKIGPLARPLTEHPEPPRWLLWQGAAGQSAGLMRAGRVGLLSAPGGTGKTLALCSLALAACTGKPWLSERPIDGLREGTVDGYAVEPAAVGGRVALLLGEEDAEEVHRRLWQVAQLMGLNATQLAAVQERLVVGALSGQDVTLVDADGVPMVDGLRRALGPGPWSLVILDPLSRFGGVEAETDNGLATRTVAALEALTGLEGRPAVVVAHHERKGGGEDAEAVRGASALVDGARWVARLSAVKVGGRRGASGLVVGGRRWRSRAGHRAVWFEVVKSNYAPPLEDGRRLLMLDRNTGAPRVARAGELKELREAEAEASGHLAPTKGASKASSKASSKGAPAPIGVEL